MTDPAALSFAEIDLDAIATLPGRIAVVVEHTGKLDQPGRRVNRLTRGALERFVDSDAFAKMKQGEVREIAFPTGLEADAVLVAKIDRKGTTEDARRAGVAMGRVAGDKPLAILAGSHKSAADLALGAVLRNYDFTAHKTGGDQRSKVAGPVTVMVTRPDDFADAAERIAAEAAGVFFARDLVNEPSNVLTTLEFARRLEALGDLGLTIRVLDEDELEALGMRTLLAVGQGSESPSRVVVMEWKGGGDERPLAVVGKGVVFDTGGISLKPAGGMEDMTMDMGGAGVVAGLMKSLAMRKASANVVGIVGLVENMPDGKAQRPGDVVRSMKGDTVEVINTDAEGRLVLCDVMWYAQEEFKPKAMIDLATLTGAMIIALGHENAGVFSNDDMLADAFLAAAKTAGEGAWRLPLGPAYDKLLKSRVADMKNVGGRPAGSITAAQFLKRFVKADMPWIHLDIAGVASLKSDGPFSPKGASGWGVRALDQLIRDRFES